MSASSTRTSRRTDSLVHGAEAATPDIDARTSDEKIEASLRTAAEGGDVAAARELRAWLDAKAQRGGNAEDYDLVDTYEELGLEGRARLRKHLLEEAMTHIADT